MPDAPVLGASACLPSVKKVKLDEAIFTTRFNEALVHQSVRAEQAARRRGTAATKTRGMVSGGGAKPWRQKGTGRARAGSNRSPIWTGGGTVFGPQPRSYTFKVNRKEQRAALRSALSLHAERGSLAVLDSSAFSAPKTKQAFDLLDDWNRPGATLVVLAAEDANAALSFRNLAGVAVLTHENVGVADLLGAASLLISQPALDALTARAAGIGQDRRGGEGLMDHSQVILRPVVSEKSYVLSAANRYTFRVHPDAHKTQIRQAVRGAVRGEGARGADAERQVQAQAPRRDRRSHARVEEGDRADRRRRKHSDLPRPAGAGLGRGERELDRPPCPSVSPSRRAPVCVSCPTRTSPKSRRPSPRRRLIEGLKKSGGRNAHGRKTSRHRGGGAKRAYRRVDFKRRKDGVPARVAAIEYDPNRSAYIALLHYADGEKRYILAPQRLAVGATVASGDGADIATGNCMELARMPVGTVVHNVELQPGRGGQLARSAGASVQLMAKDGEMATLRLPSGEMRLVRAECRATVGTIGNAEHQNVKVGKAGRKRHMGVRPQTRGVAMNPVDHPHGGGEGSTTAGRHPVTPWGVPTLGYRTRKQNKASDRYIVRGRRRGKGRSH